jgi:hypothetical protein
MHGRLFVSGIIVCIIAAVATTELNNESSSPTIVNAAIFNSEEVVYDCVGIVCRHVVLPAFLIELKVVRSMTQT